MLLSFKDIEVSCDNGSLVVGNAALRRVLDLGKGFPRTVSLCDGAGREFAAADKASADFSFIGLNPPEMAGTAYRVENVEAETFAASLFDSERVVVRITVMEATQQALFKHELILYPGLAVMGARNSILSPVMPNVFWTTRGGLADFRNGHQNVPSLFESRVDGLKLADGLKPVRAVEFRGRTDVNDEQVVERPASADKLNGNLLYCEAGDGAGLFYLQEAPPSGERRDLEAHDFRLEENNEIHSCGWGVHPAEFKLSTPFQGYRHVLALYHGAAERERLLKDYLRRRFPLEPERHCSVMVNPWGCGRFPRLASRKFLLAEIAATAEVGGTHYQIDDGWQAGGNLLDIVVKNMRTEPEFWAVSPRLDGGSAPLAAAARRAGIKLGLWLAPSRNRDYEDWEEFAEMILRLHGNDGFTMFKLDGVLVRSWDAERNLRKLLQTVCDKSAGEIYFNLDVTSGQRPGYFLMLEYGNIFLENRYVNGGGAFKYHPERTLRNFWRLARYVRAQSLQIEVPYPGDIQGEAYASQLEAYPLEYWAAVALFANPLLWFAPSLLSLGDQRRYRAIMDLHLRHRDHIFAGEIYPVGEEPDGSRLTGFQSHHAASASGLVVLYREAGAGREAEIDVNHLEPGTSFETIHGDATLFQLADNRLRAVLDDCPGFALFAYQPRRNNL